MFQLYLQYAAFNGPLMMACRNGHVGVVRVILEEFEGEVMELVQATGSNGYHTLQVACQYGHRNILEELLDAGVPCNMPDSLGRTPLQISCFYGQRAMVAFLLSRGANIHAEDRWGRQALHFACSVGDVTIVRMLLDAGADMRAAAVGQPRHFQWWDDFG